MWLPSNNLADDTLNNNKQNTIGISCNLKLMQIVWQLLVNFQIC